MRRPMLLATALAGVALCAAAAPAQDHAKVGKVPEYAFTQPIDNGPGISSLESFRGHPTLFEFWGTY